MASLLLRLFGPRAMDIDTLKIFCDIIKHKSFTLAAAANSLTQSAVSQRIKVLEKKLGIALIERHGAHLKLTKAGEVLYKGAERILAGARELEEHMKEISGKTGGSVKVATIYSVGLYELDPFVKRFLQSYPEIEVHIEYSRADKIYGDLINGSIDLGIVAYPPNKPQLRSIPISDDELVLICALNHPLGQHKSVSLKELDGQPFVAFEQDMPTRRALDELLRAHGVALNLKVEFDNIDLIKRAVEIGMGISVVPSTTVKSEIQAGLLKSLPFAEGPFTRPIALLYRRSRSLPPAVKKFISVLTENRV